ncbi:MAG: hypothetical protein BMS9Abin04_388 [Planctomycetia bacterium]|nr:MAG: hypothetical protein BMS9Abin04_388 [Planctomycetia bacterium]
MIDSPFCAGKTWRPATIGHGLASSLCCGFVLLACPAWQAAAAPEGAGSKAPAALDVTSADGSVPGQRPPAAAQGKPVSLFDGRTLAGWRVTDFGGQGEVDIEDGRIVLQYGEPLTGITWQRPFPKNNYEVALDAMRVDGIDFFCALTFPVGDEPCSLIVGGWAGSVVGLSSINGSDASENETTSYMQFKQGRWYHIRVRVSGEKIEAWIDRDKVVDVARADRTFSVRLEVDASRPFGIASFQTTAALRNITLQRIKAKR